MYRTIALGWATLAVLAWTSSGWAQIRATTQNSMFGSRTMGGFPTAGNRTFSGSGLGSSSFSGSSGGGSSFGRSSLGSTGGLGGSSSFGQSSFGSGGGLQVNSSERFVRGARQPGQFVGADTQEVGSILGSLGAGTRTMRNQNFNVRSISGQQSRPRVNQPGAQAGVGARGGRVGRASEQLAVAVELGFEPPSAMGSEVLSTTLTEKIGQSKRIQTLEPIQVSLAEGTAILRGVVATPHDRELAEQWILLEPGVRSVRNELTVRKTENSGPNRLTPSQQSP